jgi:hypothetical protein
MPGNRWAFRLASRSKMLINKRFAGFPFAVVKSVLCFLTSIYDACRIEIRGCLLDQKAAVRAGGIDKVLT